MGDFDEILPPKFEIVVLIKACRRRGKQHCVPCFCVPCRRPNGRLHGCAHLGRHPNLAGEFRGLSSNDIGLFHRCFGDVLQGVNTPLFHQAAADPADVLKRPQCLGRGINIGGLAVVDIAHPIDFTDKLRTMCQTCKGFKPLFNHAWGKAKGAQCAIGRAGVLVVMCAGQSRNIAQID